MVLLELHFSTIYSLCDSLTKCTAKLGLTQTQAPAVNNIPT
jgi:hypothetical protein